MRPLLVLVLIAVFEAATVGLSSWAQAELPETGSEAPQASPDNRSYWQTLSGSGFLSAAFTEHEDPQNRETLDGVILNWGAIDEAPYKFGFTHGFRLASYYWLSRLTSRYQELWTSGLGIDFPFLMLGPVRGYARSALGLSYRTEEPDHGLAGMGGFGIGTGVWLGYSWQLVVAADREFYFAAPDSTRYSLEIRWASPKVPFHLPD